MKFKKGRKYRVVKSYNLKCIGCILRYEGIDIEKEHYGFPKPLFCKAANKWDDLWINGCPVFERTIDNLNRVILVKHTDMVKFCKKLRKELRS